MRLTYSNWANLNDPIGKNIQTTWLDFAGTLAQRSKRKITNKTDNQLFSYEFDGSGRKAGSFKSAHFVALDLDKDICIAEFDAILTAIGVEAILYTSFSHQPDEQKLRIVLPLAEPVTSYDAYTRLWNSLNMWCGGRLDKQTKNANRVFYWPCTTEFSEFRYYEGRVLSASEWCEQFPVIEGTRKPLELTSKQKMKRALEKRELKHKSIFNSNVVKTEWLEDYWRTTDNWYHAMFSLLCKIAMRARAINVILDVATLADIMREIDHADAGGPYYNKKQGYYLQEATGALEWANQQTIEILTEDNDNE